MYSFNGGMRNKSISAGAGFPHFGRWDAGRFKNGKCKAKKSQESAGVTRRTATLTMARLSQK